MTVTPAERHAIEVAERDGSLDAAADAIAEFMPGLADVLRGRVLLSDPAAIETRQRIRTKAAATLAYEWLGEMGIRSVQKRLDRILPYVSVHEESVRNAAVKQSDAAVTRFINKNPDFKWREHLRLPQTFFDPDHD